MQFPEQQPWLELIIAESPLRSELTAGTSVERLKDEGRRMNAGRFPFILLASAFILPSTFLSTTGYHLLRVGDLVAHFQHVQELDLADLVQLLGAGQQRLDA